ncbi:MAG: hypothetical protein DLM64_09115 [Solirubrobacterales bacterium]|nr:MAG: hypothetical protein DLM64_09115 [Solirubrobacterales bacterium]
MVAQPQISVIVRARDEAASIGRCLELIGAQQTGGREVETILVDSGSRDRTIAIAAGLGAHVVSIPRRTFTFGGALNVGAANARGEVLVALSAHAFPPDSGWLARLAAPFADPRVACACGDRYDPDGARLRVRIQQDIAHARAHPQWGYSNAAGAFRAELWRAHPFRTDLPGCEDKEWAAYWLARGHVCAVDPSLAVDHDHSHDSVASIYRRARREAKGLAMFLAPAPYGLRELTEEWLFDRRFYSSRLRAWLSHRRAARLLGVYAGRRRGRSA